MHLYHFFLILTWIRSHLWVHPRIDKLIGIAPKRTEFDTLLFLLTSILWKLGGVGTLDRAMLWIVDVDIGTGSWICWFYLFIHWSDITRVECCMYRFFLDNFVFDIVLFLIKVVRARAWILMISLLSIWGFTLITPEISSFSFGQETLWFILNHSSIWL